MRPLLTTFAIVAAATMTGASLLFAAAPAPAPAAPATQPVDYWSLVATTDAADLNVYRKQNAELPPPAPGENRVVFIGDSITEGWQKTFATNFPNKPNY